MNSELSDLINPFYDLRENVECVVVRTTGGYNVVDARGDVSQHIRCILELNVWPLCLLENGGNDLFDFFPFGHQPLLWVEF